MILSDQTLYEGKWGQSKSSKNLLLRQSRPTSNHITNSSRGLSEGSRFFAKNAKIAPLLKAPDEGVMRIKTHAGDFNGI